MRTKPLSRRRLLRGIGGVAVGLPFLEEMLPSTLHAAEKAAIPTRAFNVFFGLGIPAPVPPNDFTGIFEPLAPLKEQLLVLR